MSRIEEALSSTGWGMYNKFLIGFAAMCYFTNGLSFMNVPLYLPLIFCDIDVKNNAVYYVDLSLTLGVAFGGFLLSAMSDVVGRKSIITVSLILIFISVLSSSFVFGDTNFILSQFVFGSGVAANMVVTKVHLAECLPMAKRSKGFVFLDLFWNLGCIIAIFMSIGFIPLVLKYKADYIRLFSWRYVYALSAFFTVIAACISALILPSPRYLLYDKKSQDAVNVLREMFAINKSRMNSSYTIAVGDIHGKVPDFGIQNNENAPLNTPKSCSLICKRIEKSIAILLKRFLPSIALVSSIRTFTSIGLYALNMFLTKTLLVDKNFSFNGINILHFEDELPKDCKHIKVEHLPPIDFIVLSSMAIIGEVLLICIVPHLAKKYLICLFLSGICAVLLAFIYGNYIVRFLISSVMMIAYGFMQTALDLLVIEMFPTAVRSTAYAITILIGVLSNLILRSYIVSACFWVFIGIGSMLEVAGVLSLALPNLKNRPMAD